MDRTTWTDERLDDLNHRVDSGFTRVDMRFDAVDRRFDAVDRRLDSMESRVTGQIDALRQTILRLGGGLIIGLMGVIATILARGV